MADIGLSQEIVQSIIDQTLKDSLVYIGLMLACSVLATWLITRIHKNAEIKEVTANLDEIKRQIQETTEVTEKTKQKIELEHWKRKEIDQIKRDKLEEFASGLFALASYLQSREQTIHDTFVDASNVFDEAKYSELVARVRMLGYLYFYETKNELNEFIGAASKYKDVIQVYALLKAQEFEAINLHTDSSLSLVDKILLASEGIDRDIFDDLSSLSKNLTGEQVRLFSRLIEIKKVLDEP